MLKAVSYLPFAAFSGLFAALSSVFAKLFTDERTILLHDLILHYCVPPQLASTIPVEVSLGATRLLCFVLIFGCNSVMWTLFTKALNMAPSSVQVSVINGAANLSASALLGYLVFDEPLTLRWWCGASLILAGTILLSRSQKEKTE